MQKYKLTLPSPKFTVSIADFFKNFFKNNGAWVAAAIVLSKLSFFLLNIFIARNLLKNELGMATQAQNFLGFFIPFIGMGSYQGLLKFGSGTKNPNEHQNLADYSLSYGILGQMIISVLMMVIALIIYRNNFGLLEIIAFFTVRFFGLFLVEIYKASARGGFDNRKFAVMELSVSLATLFTSILLVPFLGLKGYLVSLCISPYFILFFGLKKIDFKQKLTAVPVQNFWRFSISTAFASLLHELFYLADIFFAGLLFSEASVADYKTASLLPLNFLLFSRIFIQADYPKLCRHHDDKPFLKKYIQQFLMIFVPSSLLILSVMGIFSNQIMVLFGHQYTDPQHLFLIFLFSAFFGAVFRVPFSNMLFALGKTKVHIYISVISALLMIMLIFFFRAFGIKGIAIASAISTGISGIIYFVVFYSSFKKIKT